MDLPNINPSLLETPTLDKLAPVGDLDHPPRILMLYGSLRERSFSRFLTEEAARILEHFGAEVKIFDPTELPMVGSVPEDHPKVQELRTLSLWSEGQVWCSPERHGAITAVMKNQIDWIPLEQGALRPSQGRTLAVMQVRRIAIVQRGQHAAAAGALDAHVHDTQPVVGADGLQGIRRQRPHASVGLL